MTDVTPETFEAEVLHADKPTIVEFWAPWCGVCHTMRSMLEGFAEREKDRVRFVKVNAQEHPTLANEYSIMALPTFLVFRGSQIAGHHVGSLREDELRNLADIP